MRILKQLDKYNVNLRPLKNDRFSAKELKEMEKISYLEWNEHANHYNSISNKLDKIINKP